MITLTSPIAGPEVAKMQAVEISMRTDGTARITYTKYTDEGASLGTEDVISTYSEVLAALAGAGEGASPSEAMQTALMTLLGVTGTIS